MKNVQILLTPFLAILFFGCSEDPITPTEFVNIRGTVIDESSSEPLPEVRVTLLNTSDFVATDSNGIFRFDSLLFRESFAIRFEKTDYRDETATVAFDLSGQDTRELEIFMELDITLNPPPDPSILFEPMEGETNVAISPTLRWSAATADPGDEISYEVVLYDQFLPNSETYTTTDTFLNLENLRYNNLYYWQVIAKDGVNQDVVSLLSYFRTEVLPLFQIHFVRQNPFNGNFVIFAADRPSLTQDNDPDSLLTVQITDSTRSFWRPHLNLAAQKIAAVGFSGTEAHLFTMNRDGSNLQQVTSDKPVRSFNLLEVNYAWSPNGGRLIYPHNDRLYLINENGTGLTEFARADLGYVFVEVDWSDQNLIAARMQQANRYVSKIVLYNLNGTVLDTLVNGEEEARWQAGPVIGEGSNFLIYVEDQNAQQFPDEQPRSTWLLRQNLNGTAQFVNPANIPPNTNDLYPTIPPGGDVVMFVNQPTDGSSLGDVYTMEIGGSIQDENARNFTISNATMPDWR